MANVSVTAKAKGVDMTPRKIGIVASLIRGRSIDDALVILSHTPRRSATPLIKLLESARANAKHNHGAKGDDLKIELLHVSPGPRMKRFRPVARGSAHPYQKRSTHVTVIVTGALKPVKAKKTAAVTAKKETK